MAHPTAVEYGGRCVRLRPRQPVTRRRGKGSKNAEEGAGNPATPRPVAKSWVQRLKRLFGIQIEACGRCHGKLKVIASIEDPAVIAKILAHLDRATGEFTGDPA
jgi:hypothetical protein